MKVRILKKIRKSGQYKFDGNKVIYLNYSTRIVSEYSSLFWFIEAMSKIHLSTSNQVVWNKKQLKRIEKIENLRLLNKYFQN